MKALSEHLPERIFTTAQVRELERLAIATCGVTDYELMCRAGAAALGVLERRWPAARKLAIVCGAGNNGGDGLVVARLGHARGLAVSVLLAVPVDRLGGAAARAAADCHAAGIALTPFDARSLSSADVIVDALLGTGLTRPVADEFLAAIEAIDAAERPVLSLDVPSGLDADTGWPNAKAVSANVTLTFLGLKQGLFLGAAADHCGELLFAGLEMPATLGATLVPPLKRLVFDDLRRALPRRPRSAHKGCSGRLLLVGGGPGMAGAIRLAAEAALRVGAGLVYVATDKDNVATVLAGRPEIICHSASSAADLEELLKLADAVVVGPGLGRSPWARGLWRRVLRSPLPVVMDADGLNLLAAEPLGRRDWLLTPHPGEAARLLGMTDIAAVQRDRRTAARELATRYRATVVLKGPHSLVASANPNEPLRVCDHGNPGMATAGTGDVLAGALGSLLVQTGDLKRAAYAGVLLHALAGDAAAASGERGMVAGDLLPHLRAWANPR